MLILWTDYICTWYIWVVHFFWQYNAIYFWAAIWFTLCYYNAPSRTTFVTSSNVNKIEAAKLWKDDTFLHTFAAFLFFSFWKYDLCGCSPRAKKYFVGNVVADARLGHKKTSFDINFVWNRSKKRRCAVAVAVQKWNLHCEVWVCKKSVC